MINTIHTIILLPTRQPTNQSTNQSINQSIILGVGEAKSRRINKVKLGHYKEAGVGPKRKLAEFRVTPDALLEPGMLIQARHFVPGQLVDVCGVSKGKGTQGAMKKWNFRGGLVGWLMYDV